MAKQPRSPDSALLWPIKANAEQHYSTMPTTLTTLSRLLCVHSLAYLLAQRELHPVDLFLWATVSKVASLHQFPTSPISLHVLVFENGGLNRQLAQAFTASNGGRARTINVVTPLPLCHVHYLLSLRCLIIVLNTISEC